MSFMLRTRTRDYDLGPVLEFLKFQQELSKLAVHAEKEFSNLFGIVDLNDDLVSTSMKAAIAEEAKSALSLFKGKLSEHAEWVLGILAVLSRKGKKQ
jgi:hypothetical protein